MIHSHNSIGDVYNQYKDDEGYLNIVVHPQQAFGNANLKLNTKFQG